MKYNTYVIKDENKTIIDELVNKYKYFYKQVFNYNNFCFNNSYSVYEIKNGFTIAELEKALKIELDNNIYNYFYVFKVKSQYSYKSDPEINYYTNVVFHSLEVHKKYVAYPSNIYEFSQYRYNLDNLRKYPKSKKDMEYFQEFNAYIIIQKKNYFIKELKERRKQNNIFNFNVDRFKLLNDYNEKRNYYNIFNNKYYYNCDIDHYEKPTEGCKLGYYYEIKHFTKPDKSGYFNKHIEELKQKAKTIKKEKTETAFKQGKKDYYINLLTSDFLGIQDFIYKAFELAGNTKDFKCIETASHIKNYFDDTLKDIKRYLEKLRKNDFSSDWFNTSIINFENNIISLHNKSNIESFKKDFNNYLNFKKLYDMIENHFNSYTDFENFLKNNIGYKWSSCNNCYNEKLETISDGKMWLSNYYVKIENYFDFMQV